MARAAETGDALAGAVVLATVPDAESSVQTNEEGRFRLTGLAPGLEPGQVTEVLLSLAVEPVALPELRVEVERRYRGKLAGFWERRRMGIGHHLTPEEIEQVPASQLHRVIREVPGVRVIRCRPRYDPTLGRRENRPRQPSCYEIDSGRAPPSLLPTGPPCRVRYFVDGMALPVDELPLGINEVPKHDVEAVEVYTGASQIPVQYGGSDARCGVVLIWTRQ